MDEMTRALGKSLFSIAEDTLPDLAEVGIDQIIEDGLLQELPIFKTMCAAVKTVHNVRERNLLRQTLHMIQALRSKSIDQEKMDKYQSRIQGEPKYAEKELGRVLIILDQTIDIEKSRILGVLFGAFVNKEISWEVFCELSEITRRMFLSDFSFMRRLRYGSPLEAGVKPSELISASRLVALGVVVEGGQSYLKTVAELEKRNYALSDVGRMYFELTEAC